MKHANFVHLHLHTQFSLLDGAIRLDELFKKAKEYRMPALAITDHGAMFGAIEFYQQAQKNGIKPIIGCEVYVAPGSRLEKTSKGISEASYHLILLAKNLTGIPEPDEAGSRATSRGSITGPGWIRSFSRPIMRD